jgi:hypothetical protein
LAADIQLNNAVFTDGNKKNLLVFTEMFVGDKSDASYKTCLKLFIKEFVQTKDKDYYEILSILNKFKSA